MLSPQEIMSPPVMSSFLSTTSEFPGKYIVLQSRFLVQAKEGLSQPFCFNHVITDLSCVYV